MKKPTAIAIFMLTTAISGGVMANDDRVSRSANNSVTVNYADLNIDAWAGANVLYRRIEAAAEKVCGVSTRRDSLVVVQSQKACMTSVVESAVRKVNNSAVASIHLS